MCEVELELLTCCCCRGSCSCRLPGEMVATSSGRSCSAATDADADAGVRLQQLMEVRWLMVMRMWM